MNSEGGLKKGRSRLSLRERFESRVSKSEDGCWIWMGSVDKTGYGVLPVKKNGKGRKVWAHRLAYELYVGLIPEGFEIDHLCRNRRCVNPGHLEPVTRLENVRRGAKSRNSPVFVRKAYCKHGHPLVPGNVYLNGRGNPGCKICREEQARRRYLASREQVLTKAKERYQRKRHLATEDGGSAGG